MNEMLETLGRNAKEAEIVLRNQIGRASCRERV